MTMKRMLVSLLSGCIFAMLFAMMAMAAESQYYWSKESGSWYVRESTSGTLQTGKVVRGVPTGDCECFYYLLDNDGKMITGDGRYYDIDLTFDRTENGRHYGHIKEGCERLVKKVGESMIINIPEAAGADSAAAGSVSAGQGAASINLDPSAKVTTFEQAAAIFASTPEYQNGTTSSIFENQWFIKKSGTFGGDNVYMYNGLDGTVYLQMHIMTLNNLKAIVSDPSVQEVLDFLKKLH